MRRRILLSIACALAGANFATDVHADTFGWRGDGDGRYAAAQPPREWSKSKNVVWKAELPGRGYASPVMVGTRLFLTAEPNHVFSLDAATGKLVWQDVAGYVEALGQAKADEIKQTQTRLDDERRSIQKQYEELRKADANSPKLEALKQQVGDAEKKKQEYERQFPNEKRGGAGNAAATPVTEGRRIYVAFGTGVIAAFDLEGNRLWTKHVEATREGFGHSASPVLSGDTILVHYHDLVALDAATGKEKWRAELPAKFGTPVATKVGSDAVLICPCGAVVRISDGTVLAKRLFELSNNSPVVHNGVVYAHESGKVKAFRLPTNTAAPFSAETLWESSGTRDQRMASAVFHDGLLYAGTRSGILDVTDAATGENVYRKRLDVGELFSSVSSAGGLIFVTGNDGHTLVLDPGREYHELYRNELERSSSTPLFVDRRIYLRTDRFLYCLGE